MKFIDKGLVVAVVLVVSFLSGVIWIANREDLKRAERKAAAFERITGKHVAPEDAMYIELRIEGRPCHD